jgi:group I intron endonuclease
MKKGIYIIKNKVNNKIYIGVATVSFEKRWHEHINALKNKTHKNKHIQRAWDKYGEDNFEFIVLKEIENVKEIINKDDAINFVKNNIKTLEKISKLLIQDINNKKDYKKIHLLETYYFFKYNSIDINYGYNILKIGGSNLGNTQLTKEQVFEVENKLLNNDYTKITLKKMQDILAKEYNVSKKMIYAVRDGSYPFSSNPGNKLKLNVTNAHFKLNREKILEIEDKILNRTKGLKETYYRLAKEYGVSYNMIIDIKLKRHPYCSERVIK